MKHEKGWMQMQKTEASNQNVSILLAVVGIYERGNNRRSRGEPDPGADPTGDSEAKDDTGSGASTMGESMGEG